MKIAIVFALAVLAIGADAATSLNAPSTAAFAVTAPVVEGAAVATAYTVIIDTNTGGSVTYAIAAQTQPLAFTIGDSTGIITPVSTTSVDYEYAYAATQVLTVTGADSADTTSVTLTLTITDANDNSPIFPCTSMTATVIGAAPENTVLGTFVAYDLDGTGTNNVVTPYTIASGNTDTVFDLSTAGLLTVAAGKTTPSTGCFTLTLQAVDSGTPALTGTGTLIVTVGSSNCSSAAAAVVGSLLMALVGMLASLLQ